MRKIEVSQSFLRGIANIALELRRLSKDYSVYEDEFEARAKNPDSSDANTPEENLANSYIFRGKSDAYAYAAGKLENELRFYGLTDV